MDRNWFSTNPDNLDIRDVDAAVILMPTQPPSMTVEMLLNVRLPEGIEFDSSATAAQIGSVRSMWPHFSNDLSYMHCHSLLCYRDYAQHFLDYVYGNNIPNNIEEWQKIIVTMISYFDDVSRDVRRWSERRYRNHHEKVNVTATKHYTDLHNACYSLDMAWRSMIII